MTKAEMVALIADFGDKDLRDIPRQYLRPNPNVDSQDDFDRAVALYSYRKWLGVEIDPWLTKFFMDMFGTTDFKLTFDTDGLFTGPAFRDKDAS